MSDVPTVIEEKAGYIYGIYWQRDDPIRWRPDPLDVDWYPSYAEARAVYDSRDDKYWLSLFVQGFATIVAVEEGRGIDRQKTCLPSDRRIEPPMSEPLHGPYRSREEERGESLVPAQRKPDQLQMTIAAVQARHVWDGYEHTLCECGEWDGMGSNHADHVADAVIRELDSHGWLIDPESDERNRP